MGKIGPYQTGVSMNLVDSLEKRTTALTVSEVAKVLHISVRQINSLVASNKMPHIRVGGSIRFDPSGFAAWLRQSMIKTVVSWNQQIPELPCLIIDRSEEHTSELQSRGHLVCRL